MKLKIFTAMFVVSCVFYAPGAFAGGWFTPYVPVLPPAQQAPQAQTFIPTVPEISHETFRPTVPEISRAPQPPPATNAPPAQAFYAQAPQIPEAPPAPPDTYLPPASRFLPNVPKLPPAEAYVDP